MLDVFLTVDVEIWCDGWQNLDEQFPAAFRKYVYGPTAQGEYGLRHQLRVLNTHGLAGVFFVEPLFSTRFGREPLAEIVGLIREHGQAVELHLHTEWVDESKEPLLENVSTKRQHLRYFSLQEQITLVAIAARLLKQAGVDNINAFRAGSFAFNLDTLRSLAANHIRIDASYNARQFGLDSGVLPGITAVCPFECEGVVEYPMTVFDDGTKSLRPVQLTACSYPELESLLWQALESERDSFVLLSHGFELLNNAHDRPDDVVISRFHKLCSFLDRNRDCFKTRGFGHPLPQLAARQPPPLRSPIWRTAARMIEQAYRRRYG